LPPNPPAIWLLLLGKTTPLPIGVSLLKGRIKRDSACDNNPPAPPSGARGLTKPADSLLVGLEGEIQIFFLHFTKSFLFLSPLIKYSFLSKSV